VSAYVRELIRQDEKRKAEERLGALLLEWLEGEQSGPSPEDIDDIRKAALVHLKARKKQR
jgi:antitoxin ParD1/3/4